MIQLSATELAIVRDILARVVPERDVLVFGSRASGDARAASDLDLAVLGDAPLSLAVRGALEEAFSDSDLPMRVDIVDWSTASPEFRRLIERDARPLREAAHGER